MKMGIEIYKGSGEDWDPFVIEKQDSVIYHLYGWKEVIEQTYGHRSYYLVATEGAQIRGVLPLFRVKSILFGDHLVSLPFVDSAGVLAESKEVAQELIKKAASLSKELRVDSLSLRHIQPCFEGAVDNLEKVTLKLGLEQEANLMLKKIPSERRNRVKRAEKEGLLVTFAGGEAVDDFYNVFQENMRDLGSPVHSKLFFERMCAHLGERIKIALVQFQGHTVGAAICLFWQKTIQVPWVSSLRSFFKYYPNMMLYWGIMKYGCENGFRELDFGRSSRDSGTYEFKRQWGANPLQLHWEYYSPRKNSSSPVHVNKESQVLSLMVKIWQRVPVPIATWIGPSIRKGIIN